MTKPLTQAEIIRGLIRALTRQTAKPTVRIWTTRDGVMVDVSAPDPNLDKAADRVMATFDRVRDRYRLEELIAKEDYDRAIADGTPFE